MKSWLVLIAVVALLVILGITVPVFRDVFTAPAEMMEAVSTGMEIKRLEIMIVGFKNKYNRWPTEEEYSLLVKENFEQDRTDNLRADSLVDLWGEPYNYFRQGSGFVVTSMGPDHMPGTRDDIILLRRK